MAFAGGDWASATDPFILAPVGNIAWGSWGAGLGPPYDASISNVGEGVLLGNVNGDDDLVEIYWQKESDLDTLLPAPGWWRSSFTVSPVKHRGEFPNSLRIAERSSGTLDNFLLHPRIIDNAGASTGSVHVSYPAGGSHGWCNLFVYFALAWSQRDPAQVLFSLIAHNTGGPVALKAYLNQTSFEDASDRYDEWPLPLSCWREVGSSHAEWAKKVIDHTADMISIRPDDTSGEYQMHVHVRRSLNARTTAIDLDGESVSSYTVRPGEEYQLDAIRIGYGAYDGFDSSISSTHDYDEIEFRRKVMAGEGGGNNWPNDMVTVSRQAVREPEDAREFSANFPWLNCINETQHIDLNYFKGPQEEIEVEFADLSHYNYSVGDKVPVTGGPFDTQIECVVFEKSHRMQGLGANMKLLRLNGLAGTHPLAVDVANHGFAFRANDHGKFWGAWVDGNNSYPQGTDNAHSNAYQLPYDRWLSHSRPNTTNDNNMSLWQMDRGTSGPGAGNPEPPRFATYRANEWPLLETVGFQDCYNAQWNSTKMGDFDTGVATDFTFYFVLYPLSLANGQYLFDASYLATLTVAFDDGAGNIGFDDGGGFVGSIAPTTGWQILTFVLDGSAANQALIRRNGTTIESGLDYTRVRVQNNSDIAMLGQSNGNGNNYGGGFVEAYCFTSAHTSTEWDEIEAHLAQKFDITI